MAINKGLLLEISGGVLAAGGGISWGAYKTGLDGGLFERAFNAFSKQNSELTKEEGKDKAAEAEESSTSDQTDQVQSSEAGGSRGETGSDENNRAQENSDTDNGSQNTIQTQKESENINDGNGALSQQPREDGQQNTQSGSGQESREDHSSDQGEGSTLDPAQTNPSNQKKENTHEVQGGTSLQGEKTDGSDDSLKSTDSVNIPAGNPSPGDSETVTTHSSDKPDAPAEPNGNGQTTITETGDQLTLVQQSTSGLQTSSPDSVPGASK